VRVSVYVRVSEREFGCVCVRERERVERTREKECVRTCVRVVKSFLPLLALSTCVHVHAFEKYVLFLLYVCVCVLKWVFLCVCVCICVHMCERELVCTCARVCV